MGQGVVAVGWTAVRKWHPRTCLVMSGKCMSDDRRGSTCVEQKSVVYFYDALFPLKDALCAS